MNPVNKKAPAARGIPQSFNQQRAHTPQARPVVAQLKNAVSAQSVKPPVAPPVYRPQPVPKVLQTKMASEQRSQTVQSPRPPVAPPVYRPQSKSRLVQQKTAVPTQVRTPPIAPPVYHPQPAPKVLQLKTAVGRQSQAGQPPHQPVKLPAYTPQPAPVLLKGFGASRQSVAGKVGRAPQAFPAYGRDSTTKIVGTKSAAAPSGSVIQGAFRGRAQLVGGERLERVSTASSAHWAEDFKSNYKNVANHQYGFSIASRQQNEDDATEINAFIDAVNGDKAWADPYQFITYDDQVEPPKIRYNVHGSVYSTHADHTQLYPLYGAGIDRGRGAGDAAKLLKKRGELTDKRMCILGQLYRAQRQGQWGSEVRAFAMLSNNERALYKRVCEEEALTSAPSSLADYLPGGISL